LVLRPVNSTSFDVQGHGSAIDSASTAAGRDRETYLFALRGRAALSQPGSDGDWKHKRHPAGSYADRRLMDWALKSARQLDKLLSSTYLN
jgi:hypothetical protein